MSDRSLTLMLGFVRQISSFVHPFVIKPCVLHAPPPTSARVPALRTSMVDACIIVRIALRKAMSFVHKNSFFCIFSCLCYAMLPAHPVLGCFFHDPRM